mmetsp:Transcript_25114/g.38862  ORF Transcript_25114/g.38862 Transcript_25114/m.38862 type:complete len:120 (-) Transcript_25114:414-773(-)
MLGFRSIASVALRTNYSANNIALRAFSDAGEKLTGTCKWFNYKKGFGFIVPDDGSAEVFVHHGSIHASGFRSLKEGEPVEYTLATREDGKVFATDVTGPNGEFVLGMPHPSERNTSGNF